LMLTESLTIRRFHRHVVFSGQCNDWYVPARVLP
jgi:hypothetical protein